MLLMFVRHSTTRLAAASDKVYQLLTHGRWFSPASSTTKMVAMTIAEILLKVALKHQKSNQICSLYTTTRIMFGLPFHQHS
jgi:hypothetical protein